MGYTHYWAYLPEHDQFRERWPRMVLDAKKVLDHVTTAWRIALRGADGYDTPTLTEGAIGFNGCRQAGEDYEGFWLTYGPPGPTSRPWMYEEYRGRGFVWDFCKTAQRPYDLAVCAVLLRCHTLAPEVFAIGSDGSWGTDWAPARQVHTDLFGDPGPHDPLTTTLHGPAAASRPRG